MKKVCKSCGYWTKNKNHGRYRCYAGNCPAKKRDSGTGPLSTFAEAKRLKIKADRANGRVDKIFSAVSNKCNYIKRKLHDGKDEWFKCTHKDYHLSKWNDITPCCKKYCPKLR